MFLDTNKVANLAALILSTMMPSKSDLYLKSARSAIQMANKYKMDISLTVKF